ncbi:hypothetical protein [Rhodospirillaceae bacterium SYSU D60014]|uniref:hypothetical protein n=1 Tax=Virgifigura deserti TaxID=2268457 RepID=UPI000E675594
MIRRCISSIAATLLLLLVTACASVEPVDPNDPNLSLIYGYLDMEDAPTSADWVSIMHYDGNSESYQVPAEDGVFYHVGVVPGPYQVDTFGGDHFWNGPHIYDFGSNGRNETAIKVGPPGVYFLGAHRYVEVPTGWLEQSKFTMEPTDTPSEREILTKLLQLLRENNPEYTRQIALVEQRLEQIQ